jgi:cell division protein FtsQ
MKIIKFLASFLLTLGIIVLMVWAVVKAKEQKCTDISIAIQATGKTQLFSESDILNVLKVHNADWEEKTIKEIDLSSIHKILSRENYVKSVDNVHISGSKLQIEITLYDILLEVAPATGEKFLLDVDGLYLPYSPKIENDVILATGFIPNSYQKKETVTSDNNELFELFTVASLIKADPFYKALFHNLYVNEKQEIILYPSVGNLPVLFGTVQDAENKLKALRYMYEEVIPYMNEGKFAQLDVRFKNRIVATKTKS